MADTKIIGWGKCTISISGESAAAGSYSDIIEGSTSLSVEEGEMQEATIEGGEAEATKRKPDKYTLTFDRRLGTASDVDAADLKYIDHAGDVTIEPEETGAVTVTLTDCSCHVTISFDSTDGAKATYTFQTKGKTTDGALTDITFGTKAASSGGGGGGGTGGTGGTGN